MAYSETTTLIGFRIELKDEVLHKVFKKVKTAVLKDGVEISAKIEDVPAKRVDLEAILSAEAAATIDTITTVTAEKETAVSEKAVAEAEKAAVVAEAETAKEALATATAEIDVLKNPPAPEFPSLSRPAFLFMAKKLGMTEVAILTLIAAMPEATEEEQDAKDLAEIVFKNQQSFKRTNALLVNLVAASPLTEEQVDTAWRQAESISWD